MHTTVLFLFTQLCFTSWFSDSSSSSVASSHSDSEFAVEESESFSEDEDSGREYQPSSSSRFDAQILSRSGTQIYSAQIRSRWLCHGLFAAPGSVVTGAVCSAGALTHWYVVLETEDGWYGIEKDAEGNHHFHGPHTSCTRADATCSHGSNDKNITVKQIARRITKNFEEVLEEFQGWSEYNVTYEAMNCKGFAEKVFNFIEGQGDSSRFLGLGPKQESNNFLRMNVGTNESQTFRNSVVEEVRHEYGGLFYKQRVYVTVNRRCNLAIRDESGDVYSLTCLRAGEHHVDYNSELPTIVQVSWS